MSLPSRLRCSPGSSVLLGLLLSGVAAFACSSNIEPDTRAGEALTGGDQCAGVVLDASRFYKPKSRTDAQVTFSAGTLTFQVPASIPVTSGASGNGKVKFTFSQGGGTPITCVYRGNGGNAYDFRKCKQAPPVSPDPEDDDGDYPDGPADPLPGAGTIVTADSFGLHINKGDKKAGTTSVSLHLGGAVIDDNNACTADACNPLDGVTHTPIALDDQNACTTDTCSPATGPAHTLVDSEFCRGEVGFNDGVLTGLGANGRACSTCHVASDNFGLTPATAEARFQAMTASGGVDDALFRPIDANDFRTNGTAASNYGNLRKGLIRITFALPSNVKLVDSAGNVTTETLTDVWRSVPTVNNVALSGPDSGPAWPPAPPATIPRNINGGNGPNPNGGYQLDGRVSDLASQALGAFRGHAQASTDPLASVLSDIAAYQSALVTPAEPATLTADQAAGKAVFQRACAQCHGGPGGSTPVVQTPAITRLHDINTACPRPSDARFGFKPCSTPELSHINATVRSYEITMNVLVGGVATPRTFRRSSSDPGRFLLTGYAGKTAVTGDLEPVTIPGTNDDWNKLEATQLHGLAGTAPYFHNNSAATLAEVVDHYDAFFKRVWFGNPNGAALTSTGPIGGVPNPNRLFGVSDPSCLTTGPGAQVAACPIPFGPGEKATLVEYLKVF